MSRRLWIGLAVVSVVAIIVVAALVVPGIFKSSHVEDDRVTIIPAHWWKADMTEEQFQLLGESWGNESLTQIDLVQILWPDVVPELPQEMVDTWEKGQVRWTMEHWDDVLSSINSGFPMAIILAFGNGIPRDETHSSYNYYDFYLGMKNNEGETLKVTKNLGVVPETCYRVSLYIDDVVR